MIVSLAKVNTGIGGTSTAFLYAVPTNTVLGLTARVVGQTAAGLVSYFETKFVVSRVAGVAVAGGGAVIIATSTMAGAALTVGVDGGNNAIVQITGDAAATATWTCELEQIRNPTP